MQIKLLLTLALLIIAPINAIHAQEVNLRMRILDASNNKLVQRYVSGGEINVAGGELKIQVKSNISVARVRLTAKNSDCAIEDQADYTRTLNRKFRRAIFEVSARNTSCEFTVNAWQRNYAWAGQMDITVNFGINDEDDVNQSDPPAQERRYNITQGTVQSAEMDTLSPVVEESSHGVRVYCGVSHFSYDDPVVHPNDPDAAHLHIFWGNTAADAFSTLYTLLGSGGSSCEGGINNRSSYWMPALFDANNQVVLPERVISYYKSFGSTNGFDRNAIRPIPNGLQMLTNSSVNNSGPWNFSISGVEGNGLNIRILFPNCLQVDANNDPVLQSANNVSHLSFADGSGETAGDCPASHPYRVPQLSYNLNYAVPFNSGWSLASDHHDMQKGASLHADYIAAWDESTMNRLVQCNRESRRECQFISYENGQARYRDQLPERFLSPDRNIIYLDSTTLAPSIDRTPFGSSLPKKRQ